MPTTVDENSFVYPNSHTQSNNEINLPLASISEGSMASPVRRQHDYRLSTSSQK